MKTLEQRQKSFRQGTFAAILGLSAEFILGMYTALFVDMESAAAASSPVIMVHATLGIMLLVIAIATFVHGVGLKKRTPIVSSVVGLAMILISNTFGILFIANKTKDAYSFIMALGFMGAFISYGIIWNYARNSIKEKS